MSINPALLINAKSGRAELLTTYLLWLLHWQNAWPTSRISAMPGDRIFL